MASLLGKSVQLVAECPLHQVATDLAWDEGLRREDLVDFVLELARQVKDDDFSREVGEKLVALADRDKPKDPFLF